MKLCMNWSDGSGLNDQAILLEYNTLKSDLKPGGLFVIKLVYLLNIVKLFFITNCPPVQLTR